MGRLEGKVALITGAGRGQGEAIAERFVAEGAKVVVTDVLDEQGRAVVARLGPSAAWSRLDVADSSQWKAAVDLALSSFGKLDVLINNAGIFPEAPMLQMSEEAFMQVLRVNQLGVWLGMRAVAEAMRQAGGGSIVNTASVAGVTGVRGLSAYSSTKHAVRGLSKTAAIELGPLGVRVNTILPGAVVGNSVGAEVPADVLAKMFAHLPVPRAGNTADVANLMVFLASDESSYMTGSEILIDGGSQAGASSLPVRD